MNLFLCLALSVSAAFSAEGYKVIQKIHIGGTGAWDRLTLDEAGRRLYIANDSKVVVVDIDAGKVVGEVASGPGIHAVAVVPEAGKGFITNGPTDNVTIFDLKTLKPGSQVATGTDPGAIVLEPKTGKVYAFNLATEDKTATMIDPKTGNAAADPVVLGGKATAAVPDGTGKIWLALQITSEDWNVSSEVGVLDAETGKILRHHPIAPCDRPADLALDLKNKRAFAVCNNAKMAVVDMESGKVLSTLTIGKLASGVGIDGGMAFTANGGDGTMTVVTENGGKFEAAEQVPTAKGARVLRVDPKTHKIFIPAQGSDGLEVLVVGK